MLHANTEVVFLGYQLPKKKGHDSRLIGNQKMIYNAGFVNQKCPFLKTDSILEL